MKTSYLVNRYFSLVTVSLVLIAWSFDLNAQSRKDENRGRERSKTEYRKSDRYSDYARYDRRDDRNDRNYRSQEYSSKNKHRGYYPEYSKKHKHAHVDYYNHPKHGRVYHRFDHNPVVFHHSKGNYYYYGNHFYTYRKGIGYCVVDNPRNIYFRTLPMHCDRVHFNGHVFFRNGDLFFQYSPHGYFLVPPPIDIRFSARF